MSHGLADMASNEPRPDGRRAPPLFAHPRSAQNDGKAVAAKNSPRNVQRASAVPDVPPVGGLLKRRIDIVIASVSLFIFLPAMAIIALFVRLTLGAPILFAHNRVGLQGRPFRCYKFRTMVPDAEAVLQRALAEDPELAQEWRQTQKLKNDPRVTPLGRFLRKTSLDELPQLINVLRGDMSCVGPRPIIQDELNRYGRRSELYLASRPGITGLWQVRGRSNVSYETRIAMDSVYVQRWSPGLDAVLLLQTIPAVTRFKDSA